MKNYHFLFYFFLYLACKCEMKHCDKLSENRCQKWNCQKNANYHCQGEFFNSNLNSPSSKVFQTIDFICK